MGSKHHLSNLGLGGLHSAHLKGSAAGARKKNEEKNEKEEKGEKKK